MGNYLFVFLKRFRGEDQGGDAVSRAMSELNPCKNHSVKVVVLRGAMCGTISWPGWLSGNSWSHQSRLQEVTAQEIVPHIAPNKNHNLSFLHFGFCADYKSEI